MSVILLLALLAAMVCFACLWSYCAEGHRFSGDCAQCPLMPFNEDRRCRCTFCIENLLHVVRDYIEKEGKS